MQPPGGMTAPMKRGKPPDKGSASKILTKKTFQIIKKGTKAQPKEGGAVVPPLPTEAEPCVGALAPTPFPII